MIKTIINMLKPSIKPFIIFKAYNFDGLNHGLMRNIIFMGLVLLSMAGCSEDFDVTREWKDVPIVYGILSAQDSIHYIRLEKAFLDPKRNAIEVAQIADSLYYANATVRLQDLSDNRMYTLRRIDGNEEGKPREEGVFAQSPNWLYAIEQSAINIRPGRQYRLIIERGDDKPVVEAQTRIVPEFVIVQPRPNLLTRIIYTTLYRISWEAHQDIAAYDVWVDFKYREVPKGQSGNGDLKVVSWQVGSRITGGVTTFNGELFHRMLAERIAVDPNVDRFVETMDFRVIGAGREFYDYIRVFIANAGITGTQEIPRYTNLSEGFGIFSSRSRMVNAGVRPNPETIELIRNGEYTKNLGFKG
jgi:hypothetical protein